MGGEGAREPGLLRRAAGSPLRYAVLELDGRDEAYAIYRLHTEWSEGSPAGRLQVVEAIATSGEALRELWSYLFGIDLVARIQARRLPPDHPLFVATAEPARLRLRMGDGLWLRLVDLEAALAARSVSAGDPVVVEVADADCPWNAGVWRLGPDGAERTDAKPELRLGIAELGSVYLGGFTFAALAWSGGSKRSSRERWSAPIALPNRPDAVVSGGLLRRVESPATGAVSSVGRAPARQAGGHWFEPSTAHSRKAASGSGLSRLSVRIGGNAERRDRCICAHLCPFEGSVELRELGTLESLTSLHCSRVDP